MVRAEIYFHCHQQRVQLSQHQITDARRYCVWILELSVEGELPENGGHGPATARLISEALRVDDRLTPNYSALVL
jgi:hypothetical protein